MPEYGYQVAPAVDFLNSLLREERAPEVPEVDADLRPYLASLVVAARRNAKADRDAALRRAEAAEARLREAKRSLRNCLLLASSAIVYKNRGDEKDWRAVVRFCAEAGVVPSPLRATAPAAPSPDDGEAEAEGRLVFSCPHCGNPSATAKEGDVDIHSGATYHCGKCGGAVVFSAETPEEYTARFDRPAPAAPPEEEP